MKMESNVFASHPVGLTLESIQSLETLESGTPFSGQTLKHGEF